MPRPRSLIAGLVAVAVLATVFTLLLRSVLGETENLTRANDRSVSPQLPDPTRIRASQSMFAGENFGRALAALQRRVGARAPVVRIQVVPFGLDVHIRRGDRDAYGFQWFANERRLRPIQVRVVGGGSLRDEDFLLGRVARDAARKLAARVREEGPAFEPRAITLERVPPDGYLLWTAEASSSDGRAAVWNARADGTGFANPRAFARRFRRP